MKTLPIFLIFIQNIIAKNGGKKPYITEGGWKTFVDDILVKPGPCNIPIIDWKSFSNEQFLKEFAYQQPFVLRDGRDNTLFRALCRRDQILEDWGDKIVVLSAANSFSYEKRKITFQTYCDTMMNPQKISTPANETFYFFGDNDVVEWDDLLMEYQLPPLSLPLHQAALSFGCAGPGTGVPFHFHGPGFAESIYGRKRWFLTAPDVRPEFHPNKTTLQWFLEDYPSSKVDKNQLYECTLKPGEVIYFPDKWWHATLNLDTSVFISTFLSP